MKKAIFMLVVSLFILQSTSWGEETLKPPKINFKGMEEWPVLLNLESPIPGLFYIVRGYPHNCEIGVMDCLTNRFMIILHYRYIWRGQIMMYVFTPYGEESYLRIYPKISEERRLRVLSAFKIYKQTLKEYLEVPKEIQPPVPPPAIDPRGRKYGQTD